MGNDGSKPIVPVSALVSLVEDRDAAYERYAQGIRSIPTVPMIRGVFEHEARRIADEALRRVYLGTDDDAGLREAYLVLAEGVDEAARRCRQRYGALAEGLDRMGLEILNRLRLEEDLRVAAASNLLQDGIRGLELVRRVLPWEVEVHLKSGRLGLEGRVDAVSMSRGLPYPIEYKTGFNGNGQPRPSHRVQIVAYCMLLEAQRAHPCSYGEIHYTRYHERVPIWVSDEDREHVLETREEFLQLCGSPPGTKPIMGASER